MKKHITLLLCLLLNSCNIINNSSVNSTSSSINSSVSNSTSTILSSSTSSNSSSISSSSHSSVNKNDNITRELHLLATNDTSGVLSSGVFYMPAYIKRGDGNGLCRGLVYKYSDTDYNTSTKVTTYRDISDIKDLYRMGFVFCQNFSNSNLMWIKMYKLWLEK